MIEILHQYWQALLWSDGYRFTGMAVTLWLLISSVVMGGYWRSHWRLLGCLNGDGSVYQYGFLPIYSVVHRCMCSYWCSIPECIVWR